MYRCVTSSHSLPSAAAWIAAGVLAAPRATSPTPRATPATGAPPPPPRRASPAAARRAVLARAEDGSGDESGARRHARRHRAAERITAGVLAASG